MKVPILLLLAYFLTSIHPNNIAECSISIVKRLLYLENPDFRRPLSIPLATETPPIEYTDSATQYPNKSLSIVNIPIEMITRYAMSNNQISKNAMLYPLKQIQPRWLLSIDGGGVRSIMQLQIIAAIEKATKKSIVELFDGIAGTSTGGIIACLLTLPDPKNPGKPKYSAQDLLDIFTARKSEFFKSKWQSCFGLFGTRYKTTALKKLLIDLFGDNLFSERLLPTVIATHNLITNEEKLISSNNYEDFFTWSIALATSAAPTYFKPQKISPIGAASSHRGYVLSGGSTCMHNPTMAGVALMHDIYNVDSDNLNILSIGSGNHGITKLNTKLQSGGILTWGFNIVNTCIAGKASSTDKLAEFYCKGHYHRLNPILDQSNMKFDNTSEENHDALFAAAHQCIKDNLHEINRIITLLTNSFDIKNKKFVSTRKDITENTYYY